MNNGLQGFGGNGGFGGGTGGGLTLMVPQRVPIIPDPMYNSFSVNPTTGAISVANAAFLVPFFVPRPVKLVGMSFIAVGAAGTVDVGVYSDLGNHGVTASRIVTSGAVAVGAGLLTTTVPGLTLSGGDQRYYMVITGSTVTTLSFRGLAWNPSSTLDLMGLRAVGGAGPTLGAALTLATVTSVTATTFVPFLALDLAPAG